MKASGTARVTRAYEQTSSRLARSGVRISGETPLARADRDQRHQPLCSRACRPGRPPETKMAQADAGAYSSEWQAGDALADQPDAGRRWQLLSLSPWRGAQG